MESQQLGIFQQLNKLAIILVALLPPTSAAAKPVPLPKGQPLAVARTVLAEYHADHCQPIRASRRKDHTIRFVCADGSAHMLWEEHGFMPTVIPCETARRFRFLCAD